MSRIEKRNPAYDVVIANFCCEAI